MSEPLDGVVSYGMGLAAAFEAMQEFKALIAGASDEELEQKLKYFLNVSAETRLLAEIGELILYAWLEARPSSEIARRILVGELVLLGRGREAIEMEDGGAVGALSTPEDRAERLKRNLARSGPELGFDPPPT